MSPRKKVTAAAAPAAKGDVQWSIRGAGAIPAGLGAEGATAVVTDAELAQLVDSSAYRVLELIPQLSHDEILDAIAGVDDPETLTLYILRKEEGAYGTLDSMDALTWIDGGGPQLIAKMHGGGSYQLRVQARKNGVRSFIKQPMFRVPGRVVSAAAPASSTASTLEIVQIVTTVAAALTPLVKAIFDRPAPPPVVNPVDIVQMFHEGLKLGKESMKNGNGGDGDQSFGRTMREIIPGAMEALKAVASSSTPPAAPALPAPPPAAALPPGPPPPAWVQVLIPHVPKLMNLAGFFAQPDHWAAQVVHEHMDEQTISFVDEQLQRGPAFRAEFFQYFPEAIKHRDWFEQFFDAVEEELDDDDGEGGEGEEGGELGDQVEPQPQLKTHRDTLPGFE